MTTPAGINPFTGDPNWQRIASYLIGPAANGITLDANGSLLVNVSSSSFGGTAPIRVNGTQISLSYLSPLALSGTALTVSYTSPIALSGGNLTVSTNLPIYINGTKLDLNIQDPLYVSSGELAVRVTSPVYIDGGGAIAVDLSSYASQKDSGEQSLSSGAFTWADGTPPSSFSSATYRWVQVGNLVTFWVRIAYSSAGVSNSGLSFALPGGAPTPSLWSSNPNSEATAYGAGHIGPTAFPDGSGVGGSAIGVDSGGNWIIGIHNSPAQNAKYAWATLSYYA